MRLTGTKILRKISKINDIAENLSDWHETGKHPSVLVFVAGFCLCFWGSLSIMLRDLQDAPAIAPKSPILPTLVLSQYNLPAMGSKVIQIVNKNRPVNLDISTIKLPITAVVSILHRFSGIFLFAGAAVLLWMLDSSLGSPEGFAAVRDASSNLIFKLVLWAVLSALAYHTVMGIRHLMMDCGVGESLEGGKRGATIAFVLAIVLIVLIGVWVW